MKKLKKILAVSTAVSVLSLSLCLPTDCVSAANSNNAVSYTVFSLKRGGTYKTKYTLNPVDTLSSTNTALTAALRFDSQHLVLIVYGVDY